MSMSISKEDGKRKTKGCPSIPFFFRSGNFLLVERGQECLYLDDFLSRGCQCARKGICCKKISFNWKVVTILPTAFSKPSAPACRNRKRKNTRRFCMGLGQFRLPSSLVSTDFRKQTIWNRIIFYCWKLILFFHPETNNRRLVSYNKSQTRSCHLTCNHCKYFRCQPFHYFSFIYPITTTCSTCRYGLSRFCSEKVKRLLRNMPKSCSKVAQYWKNCPKILLKLLEYF